ncbi:MAG: histidine kinase, partial [Prevotella sp.]|nr:histidine kinase [Prevotella sp.]
MRHYIITLLLALSAALGTFAQGGLPGKYNMMNINMVSGMPSNFIDDIYQDSNGFMWFSTHGGGLVRYDGFSYLSFGVNGKGVQLRSNSSRNVYEDKFKRLWVAFEEGFQVMSLNTLQPVSPKCATKEL